MRDDLRNDAVYMACPARCCGMVVPTAMWFPRWDKEGLGQQQGVVVVVVVVVVVCVCVCVCGLYTWLTELIPAKTK